ncbi:MAG: heme-binding protein, partial [Bacteroidota bacterium]
KIAMTAPVHMQITDSGSTMSFVMPSGFSKENIPAPNDSIVKIQMSSEEHVAAITFGGYANDKRIKSYSAMLEKLLDEKGITHSENFRFLGYNPPYQFWNRKNEIIVQVDIGSVKTK